MPLITTTPQGGTLEMKAGFPDSGQLVFNGINSPGKLQDKFTPGDEPAVLAYPAQGEEAMTLRRSGDELIVAEEMVHFLAGKSIDAGAGSCG